MIIVDSSIWIDHLRSPEPGLAELARHQMLRMHPFVLAEIALGNPPYRQRLLDNLKRLLPAPVAPLADVLTLIDSEAIFGKGVGFVDAHLLASARLRPGTLIWTRDKRLLAVAKKLNLAMRTDSDF